MGDVMAEICDDLAAEKADLAAVLLSLHDTEWELPTPAEGWAIRDQVGHLAYFDEKALLAHREPESFVAALEGLDVAALTSAHLAAGRGMTPGELLEWWHGANAALVSGYRVLDPAARVPWYGPTMSVRSKITARIMETWAHGQDIADGLGIVRTPTSRLRHVCHIGVRSRGFAFVVNGLLPPADDVRVELAGPDGDLWTWGDENALQRVTGSALGFALLATQRRHRADVDVSAVGEDADRWLDIAQAYAGPPGPGRRQGEFATLDPIDPDSPERGP